MTKSHFGFHGTSDTKLGVLTAWLPWQPHALSKETIFIIDTEHVHGELHVQVWGKLSIKHVMLTLHYQLETLW